MQDYSHCLGLLPSTFQTIYLYISKYTKYNTLKENMKTATAGL
jgi:hypothetical protein